jgi:phage terminase small subunit
VKQRSFIKEYLKCPKGSESAKRAGYSIKCDHQQAYENLRKTKIKEIIDRGVAAQTRAVFIKAGLIGPDEDLPEMFS